jgi:5-oxoprolinase (ATP-hydrolysing)
MSRQQGHHRQVNFSIDRGGTFTDVYAQCGDISLTEKLLSNDPDNYADAPSEGIRRLLERINQAPVPPFSIPTINIGWIRMGTTVATNALLERQGTDCALVITKGFGDLLRIGYQNRPELFVLNIVRPEQIYRSVVEIEERVRPLADSDDKELCLIASGTGGESFVILRQPEAEKIRDQLQEVYSTGIRSLAVVLMHGYSFTEHEQLVGSIARSIGFEHVSLSHEVMPRIKIVGRGDTCCIDAYLSPHITAYLQEFRKNFRDGLKRTPLFFMQSDGGLTEADNFRGFNAILSGPAGGVVGYAMTTYHQMGGKPVIGFDMGGTSTDVSRYDGEFELVHETETAGVRIQAPQIDIRTVAAGGGSRLFYRNSQFKVGPESAGAHPGPVCYRKNGYLAVTDANLLLGRLQPGYFPRIFGPDENLPIAVDEVRKQFSELTGIINNDPSNPRRKKLSPEEAALGFLDVANEVMVRPIREVSIIRGFNVREHILACFGGAGGQHAAAIARKLGIRQIYIHRDAGILSALGIGAADVILDRQEPAGAAVFEQTVDGLLDRLRLLARKTKAELTDKGYKRSSITCIGYLNLRYKGTDTAFMIPEPEDNNYRQAMSDRYNQEFGFDLKDRELLVDDIRIRAVAAIPFEEKRNRIKPEPGEAKEKVQCYFAGGWRETPVYLLDDLGAGQCIDGPALIIQHASTVVVEPFSTAKITEFGDIVIQLHEMARRRITTEADPILLAIFSNRFMSIAEQMGRVLQKTALSTNIKERLDFSCAIFDRDGGLVANAPHVPVHLGAMSEAVKKQIALQGDSLRPGDVLVSNHPTAGGSHLPDITVITPVWQNGSIRFFVASRGHHSDVGGISPGSMPPFSRTIDDEGLHIKSFKMIDKGRLREQQLMELLATPAHPVRDKETLIADLKAQAAANQRGIDLLLALMAEASEEVVFAYMNHIQNNAETAVRMMLKKLAGDMHSSSDRQSFAAEDMLDNGSRIRLKLTIEKESGSATFDFTGTGSEMWGNLNAPVAVTQSAILYALRCLIKEDIPLNQGCLKPITIILPRNCLLNPSDNAAVVGGNVLTSQRIVDVIFKAAGAAAASQGCMNNLTFGDSTFGYYETIGGGSGAGPGWDGCSGVHTHMTNTRITDPEILEHRYPVMLREFSLRRGSGGDGRYRGGDGIVRDIEILGRLNVTILSQRRVFQPYGMKGGKPGKRGKNIFITAAGLKIDLGGKNEISAGPGDRIRILTPGGGGWGQK